MSKSKWFFIFLIFGLTIFCYPMLLSGFDLMPGDGTDVKTFGYLLEHSRLWLLRVYPHEELWNAPFYYPSDNTLAFSDAIIGIMPIYWFSRIFWNELSSVQAVFILMCIFNYSSFYYLLNSKTCKLNFSALSSSIASFIFAFGLMRYYRMSHLNYYCQFYTILALIFLFKIDKANSKLKNNLYFIFAFGFLSIQFYSCYTLAYYFCLIFAFAIIFSFCFKDSREYILNFLKDFYKYIVLYCLIFAVSLIPLICHYLDVGQTRTLTQIIVNSTTPFAWIRNLSIFDSFLINDTYQVDDLYYLKHELSASSGIVVTIIALFGLSRFQKIKWILYSSLLLIFISSCTINGFNIWSYLYYIIPGAQGIRIIVRISFIGLIIICFGVAKYIDCYKERKMPFKIIFLFSLILMLIEQIPYLGNDISTWSTYCWSKSVFQNQIEESAKQIDDKYKIIKFNIFFTDDTGTPNSRKNFKTYEIVANIENLAMWSALKKHKYTLNGITGIMKNYRNDSYKNMYQRNYFVNIEQFDNEKYLLSR